VEHELAEWVGRLAKQGGVAFRQDGIQEAQLKVNEGEAGAIHVPD
jgi:hypothetical protein